VYVEACCELFRRALEEKKDGQFSIAARKLLEGVEITSFDGPTPEFFVEKSRQTKFKCAVCGNHNDILGRYGYFPNRLPVRRHESGAETQGTNP
jgi:hypothetical protein